jgi:pre-60S factor REI1
MIVVPVNACPLDPPNTIFDGILSSCSHCRSRVMSFSLDEDMGLGSEAGTSLFTCTVCGIEFDSSDHHRAHFKQEWHLYNSKRRIAGLQPISEGLWEEKLDKIRNQQEMAQQQISEKQASLDRKLAQPPRITKEFVAPPLGEKTCFFDNSVSESLSDNLAYMSLKHSFFIPYVDWVSDWAGLMTYLCERVILRHQCITCGKLFKSAIAVQTHMSDRGHTRINLDDEEFLEAIEGYYDFSTKEEIVDELDILEDGSLQLPSGATLTHRDFAYIYQQRITQRRGTPTPRPRSQLPSLLNVGPNAGSTVTALMPAGTLKRLAKQLSRAMKTERDRYNLAVGVRNNKTMRRSYRSSIVEMYSYGK